MGKERGIRFLPVAMAWLALALGASWSIRAGWADYLMRQETVKATEQGIVVVPDNAELYARLAWLEAADDPQKAGEASRRAVALNPWDAQSWIELGFLAEAKGDERTAARQLLRAAEVDHTFLPRWTLANYYFRQNNPAMFWSWAKQAAPMIYGDAQPFFKLCGRVEEDGTLIERLEIQNPEVRAAYLYYLMGQNRIDLIRPAVWRLLRENREADAAVLLAACDRLLEAGRAGETAEIWNKLADGGRVRFHSPAGGGAQLLANASFEETPSSRGFDWRLPAVEGVSISQEEESRGLRVTFSGSQPEDCEMLVELVPLPGKTQYELSFHSGTHGIANGAGLAWRITDPSDGAVLSEIPVGASEKEAEARRTFQSPASCHLLRLALRYRRAPGTTRIEGYLVIRNVGLKAVAQSAMEGARVRK